MPINWANWMAQLRTPEVYAAFEREEARWDALSPEERAEENKIADARREKYRKHMEWLNYCAANGVHPGLVKW